MFRIGLLFTTALSVLFLNSCGVKQGSSGGGGGKKGEIESAFEHASKEFDIPVRFMLAAAYLESGISPVNQTTPYYDVETPRQQINLGTTLTETAFGITRKELGLSKEKNSDDLAVQINAYAKWLRKRLSQESFELDKNPSSADEKYWWIWKLAQYHRNGDELAKNIRVVWALNMIKILNTGFIWQNPLTGENIELKKESEEIDQNELQADARRWLQLTYDVSDIANARMFELTHEDNTGLTNVPTHIEVIHCPLTISGCLELQDTSLSNDVGMGAHYVIPQDDVLVPRALQITQHERTVMLTDKNGHKKPVTDAIVIMLVGNSGQYENGVRVNADPTWFSDWQLKKMGAVISGVCKALASDSDLTINERACQTPAEENDGGKGVRIQHQGLRAKYRWGDVPDFDKAIFNAYLRTSDHNIEAEVQIEFKNAKRTYKAGKPIEFNSSFHIGVRYLRLQRAIRCDDKQLVWETIHSEPIMEKKTNLKTAIKVLDAGPNSNGRQFLRVLVHTADNKLSGWAINDFYVTGFDKDFYPPAEACFASNTNPDSVSEGFQAVD